MTDHQMTHDPSNDPTHDLTNDLHRASCASCEATWAELDAISAEARRLPLLTPSRDLWSGIERRLGETAVTPIRRTSWAGLPMVRFAAAAALLIVVTATVTWRIATDDAPLVASSPSDGASVDVSSPGTAPSTEVRTASHMQEFSAMDGEIIALETLLAERRDQLDSTTVRVLQKNLAVIDQAIAESRAALAMDPASQFLTAQLARSYTIKLSLLRSTATRPIGT